MRTRRAAAVNATMAPFESCNPHKKRRNVELRRTFGGPFVELSRSWHA
ncbi:hypothetical protein ACFW1P_16310 [Paenibacillus sp. NPDC058910]